MRPDLKWRANRFYDSLRDNQHIVFARDPFENGGEFIAAQSATVSTLHTFHQPMWLPLFSN